MTSYFSFVDILGVTPDRLIFFFKLSHNESSWFPHKFGSELIVCVKINKYNMKKKTYMVIIKIEKICMEYQNIPLSPIRILKFKKCFKIPKIFIQSTR